VYHGRILVSPWHLCDYKLLESTPTPSLYPASLFSQLPPEYPFKPPHIVFLTPSGRFETNTKVCLSFSAFHPELWQPAWGIRLILEALISFLPTPADGAIGALDWSKEERKRYAKLSLNFRCPTCGLCSGLLPKLDQESKKKGGIRFAKEIAELQRLQQAAEKKKTVVDESSDADNLRNDKEESREEGQIEIITESISQEPPEEEIIFGGGDSIDHNSDDIVHAPPPQLEAASNEGGNVQSPDPIAVHEENLELNVLEELEAALLIHDPSWMYDSLLNLMLVLMAAICYLLIQKYQELMGELREIRQLSLDPA
jgi:ubiquitin-conjugating enzyme E2 J1